MDISSVLDKWFSVTEVYDEGAHDNWLSDVRAFNKRIKLAVDLDETLVTAFLIVKNVLNDYLDSKRIPLRSLVEFPEKTAKFLELCQDLIEMSNHPGLLERTDNFRTAIKSTMKKSGLFHQKVSVILDDPYKLAELRLSALKSCRDFRVDQFSRDPGAKASKGGVHIFNSIYEFVDINNLLNNMAHQSVKDGIYLCFIRDKDDNRYSYFVFAVKNGGNIYLVSDKPGMITPNYRKVGRQRSVDRKFEERIENHFFPYELIGVEWDENNSRYHVNLPEPGTSIKNVSVSWNEIGKITDAEPESIVWISLVCSLIQLEYFGDIPVQLEELSYTGMMISLLGNEPGSESLIFANASLAQNYESLKLESFTAITVRNENASVAEVWDYPSQGINQWLEDRYEDKVNDKSQLNRIVDPADKVYLSNTGKLVYPSGFDVPGFSKHELSKELVGLNTAEYGTTAELKKILTWVARTNKAAYVSVMANREYEDRKKKILNWYAKAAESNLTKLKSCIAAGKCEINGNNILRFYDLRSSQIRFSEYGVTLGKIDQSLRYYHSAFSNTKASLGAVFAVKNANQLSEILGLPISALPDVLQNVDANNFCSVNSILNLVDPMDLIIDPWSKKFPLKIRVMFSRSDYKNICKEHRSTPIPYDVLLSGTR